MLTAFLVVATNMDIKMCVQAHILRSDYLLQKILAQVFWGDIFKSRDHAHVNASKSLHPSSAVPIIWIPCANGNCNVW